MTRRQGPLAGLRVVEVAGIGPGPMAGMLLADQGAEVVRVERPAGHDAGFEVEPRFVLANRGKQRIQLDLKQPAAIDVLLALILRADALIEGFRPGVAERLGFGPDVCQARNQGLVYARVTGWGQTGPMSQRAGHDLNYIAAAGVLHAIGPADGPPVPPLNLVGDFGGGALYAVFGILAALHERQRSGKGQVIDVAMAEGAMSLLTSTFGYTAAGRHARPRGHNLLDGGAPYYGVYQTADDRYITLAPLEPGFFATMLDALGLDRAWLHRRQDEASWPELRRLIAAAVRTRTQEQWRAVLELGDSCFAPVLPVDETVDNPHFAARGSVVVVDGIAQPAPTPRFSRSQADPVASIRPPGADTETVLAGLGYDAAAIADLQRTGVLG